MTNINKEIGNVVRVKVPDDYELGNPRTESMLLRFKENTDEKIKQKETDLKLVNEGRKVVAESGIVETANTVLSSIRKLRFYRTVLDNIKII